MKNKIGVTLVEIMIVVAIMAIVAAFAVPNYLRSRQTANSASIEQTMRQIAQKMEMIFWGQNPNEYPPQSAIPNGLVTWAAPTNLGNIADLKELIKKLCEEQGKTFTAEQLVDEGLIDELLALCFELSPPLTYVAPGEQTYLFSATGSDGTIYTAGPGGISKTPPPPAECSADGDCDNGVYCDGVETCQNGQCQSSGNPCDAGYTCYETYQECGEGICGNDIWEGYEECGEEGYDCGVEYLQCNNCICEFVGCPEGYYFDPNTWQCIETPDGCPSGTSWMSPSGCCDPCPSCPPFPRPAVPPCGEVGEVIPDAPTGPSGG